MNEWEEFDSNERPRLTTIRVAGVDLQAGDRVRLWPQNRADIMDMALEGKTAAIESIEQDFDNQVHLAVVIDDDPGRDLGLLRQIGHRFFFAPDEIEPLAAGDRPSSKT
jgi:hypothetical protein